MAISKSIKYSYERKELLERLFQILKIDNNNRLVIIDELNENEEMMKNVESLVPDIKKYFPCGGWMYFHKSHKNKSLIPLIKNILRDLNIEVSVAYIMNHNNKSIRMKCFYIHK